MGVKIAIKILEREQQSNMKTLQNKHFWRRKRAVLENQRVAVESRLEIASDREKTETLWAYACRCFSEILSKKEEKWTQIGKVEHRSGPSPVVVSAIFDLKSTEVATFFGRSRPTPVVVSAIYKPRREPDNAALENYQYRFQYD